jgi:hypothetical protein
VNFFKWQKVVNIPAIRKFAQFGRPDREALKLSKDLLVHRLFSLFFGFILNQIGSAKWWPKF